MNENKSVLETETKKTQLEVEEMKTIINFLDRTDIKGIEAETMAHLKNKLRQLIME